MLTVAGQLLPGKSSVQSLGRCFREQTGLTEGSSALSHIQYAVMGQKHPAFGFATALGRCLLKRARLQSISGVSGSHCDVSLSVTDVNSTLITM